MDYADICQINLYVCRISHNNNFGNTTEQILALVNVAFTVSHEKNSTLRQIVGCACFPVF